MWNNLTKRCIARGLPPLPKCCHIATTIFIRTERVRISELRALISDIQRGRLGEILPALVRHNCFTPTIVSHRWFTTMKHWSLKSWWRAYLSAVPHLTAGSSQPVVPRVRFDVRHLQIIEIHRDCGRQRLKDVVYIELDNLTKNEGFFREITVDVKRMHRSGYPEPYLRVCTITYICSDWVHYCGAKYIFRDCIYSLSMVVTRYFRWRFSTLSPMLRCHFPHSSFL